MKKIFHISYFLIFIIAFSDCKREKNDFAPTAELNITVINDLDQIVPGALVTVYNSSTGYEQAVATKNFSSALLSVPASANGISRLVLDPNTRYYFLITYFDASRNLNLSNFGLSGVINPLPTRSKTYIEAKIRPDDANLIFYTTVPGYNPIAINVAASKNYTNKNFTLTGVYTGTNEPNVNSINAVRVTRDPGIYTYYAKSSNGCVWSGSISIERGQQKAIDLNSCNSGLISFYTSVIPDSLLPLKVVINRKDTVGTISARRSSLVCTDDRVNTVTFYTEQGPYDYEVISSTNKCIWTGSFKVNPQDCIIIPINQKCE